MLPLSSFQPAPAATCSLTCPRRNAVRVVLYTNLTTSTLLGHACEMVNELQRYGSSCLHAQATQAADRALTAMGDEGLAAAVAAAARSLVATTALVHSEAGQRDLAVPTSSGVTELLTGCVEETGYTAAAVCKYMVLLSQGALQGLLPLRAGGSGPAPSQVPSQAAHFVEVLASSELLAAAATVLVDAPPVYALKTLPDPDRNRFCLGLRAAVETAAMGLYYTHEAHATLVKIVGPEGQRLACGLLRAMRHVAVRRLQVGLLDQLAAHAGMGAALQEKREEQEGCKERQPPSVAPEPERDQAGGWAASSGAWWFAGEAARQELMVGVATPGREGPRGAGDQAHSKTTRAHEEGQEDRHCRAVYVTLGEWFEVQREQVTAAAAGVPAGPPPLLAAQLAARAAEALCRLCRGQGLEGAYAPAPEWQFAMAPVRRRAVGACAATL